MARVKRGVTSHAKHKKTFKAAKVFTVVAKTLFAPQKRRSIARCNTPLGSQGAQTGFSRIVDSAS